MVGMRAVLVMPVAQRKRVQIAGLLRHSMCAEVRGLNSPVRSADDTAALSNHCQILGVSDRTLCLVDRMG
jgi:hypothetical protein